MENFDELGPCETNCIEQLIDPICSKCDEWYQYWADVDSSDDLDLGWYQELADKLSEKCSDPNCICRTDGWY